MNVDIPSGKYVVAVSGGVDSMALLSLLAKNKALDLVVAHIDHGIRSDSQKDRVLVEKISKDYGLCFEYIEAKLGKSASEALARKARYDFLESVLKNHKAGAIITAHHQDDVLETAVLNMLRGTGRKGISSLSSTHTLLRPLLNFSKKEILKYANDNHLSWNEDSTNSDNKYLRNYVRINLLPKFSEVQRAGLLRNISDMAKINKQVDEILNENLSNELSRRWFSALPHEVAGEVVAAWLRKNNIRDFDRKLIEKLVVDLKVANNGKNFDVKKGVVIKVAKNTLILTSNK